MNAQELRIGNFIKDCDNGFPMYVVLVSEDYVYLNFDGNEVDIMDCDIQDVKPIPITPQWLMNFGFKKQGNDNFVNGCSSIHPINLTEWAFLANTNSYKTEIRKNIQYVHELQNIYYTETNKELKYENITE